MKLSLSVLIACLLITLQVKAESEVVTIKSSHDVGTTVERLEMKLKEKGMTVFIKVSHSDGAKTVAKKLRPTELVIFGNPKIGTLLMQCQQQAGIDLPQKALIWQDANDAVWFSYNDPSYIIKRHAIKNCNEVAAKISKALQAFAKFATSK